METTKAAFENVRIYGFLQGEWIYVAVSSDGKTWVDPTAEEGISETEQAVLTQIANDHTRARIPARIGSVKYTSFITEIEF